MTLLMRIGARREPELEGSNMAIEFGGRTPWTRVGENWVTEETRRRWTKEDAPKELQYLGAPGSLKHRPRFPHVPWLEQTGKGRSEVGLYRYLPGFLLRSQCDTRTALAPLQKQRFFIVIFKSELVFHGAYNVVQRRSHMCTYYAQSVHVLNDEPGLAGYGQQKGVVRVVMYFSEG
ncbi:hypothetical protein BJV78DRAFT_1223093 [Lactifluus subvellereus]|nr:hypothetical protein BJV78DRAFT_1223093 [Lactifluus subvellereus]